MYDTCIALVIERVYGCSLGWKSWWFEGLVVWEFFKFFRVWWVMNSKRCYSGSVVIGRIFSQMKVKRAKRNISWDLRIFDEWKVKAEAWLKLKVQKISSSHPHLLSIGKNRSLLGGALMWETYLCLELLEGRLFVSKHGNLQRQFAWGWCTNY